MEVEAKFTIPDRNTMDRLKRVVRLGPFEPGPPESRRVRDVYYDTAARDLYEHGYACRVREQANRRVLTIKGLGQTDSAIHERAEVDLVLGDEAGIAPETWPNQEVWAEAREILGHQSLDVLFVVEQMRLARALHRQQRLVAELTVDQVQIQAAQRQRSLRILEAELCGDGTKEDLDTLSGHLVGTWGLIADPLSKFHHGLALLGQSATETPSDDRCLTSAERTQLEYIAKHAVRERVRKRAQLLLGWDQGVPARRLASEVGGSRSWAYGWIARFRDEGMAIFADELLAAAGLEAAGDDSELQQPELMQETRAMRPEGATIEELWERFQVDVAHARRVASHALALFDATSEFHKLEPGRRRLLETMGLLHNIGMETDPSLRHIAGRDILLDHPLSQLSEMEQRMLAAAVYLHRKRIKRKRLRADVVTSLPRGIREDMLALAALLRMADGLDSTRDQYPEVDGIHVTSAGVYVSLSGPPAESSAARAQARSDLWERLFGVPIFFTSPEVPLAALEVTPPTSADEEAQVTQIQPEEPTSLTSPGLLADDTMGEAGRKVLRFHFGRMLRHEPGTRGGQDIEELHDMRVATRRMRSALPIFAPYFKAAAIRPYAAGLRRTARTLGAVRDLDVLMEKAQAYLVTLGEGQEKDLDPLLALWKEQRERARGEMLAYLDSPRYEEFKESFRLFVETPGIGVRKQKRFPPQPVKARHVMPTLIYTRWAGVKAFDDALDGASVSVLHALRIECKRLRYTLEFSREILGASAPQVIAEVVKLQDHLGNLNDADVANRMLSDFLFASSDKETSEPVIAPGVVAYLAAKQRELQDLLATFPDVWAHFNRPELKQWLADAVASL
jgi:CHAD domain-containing protein